MGKEKKSRIGSNKIKEVNIKNIMHRMIETYKQNSFEIVLLSLNVILLPFFFNIYYYILYNNIIYLVLFLCCGVLVFTVSRINTQKQFIKISIIFIFALLILNSSLSMLFTMLAFGGKQGHLILSYIPINIVMLSITSKFTVISIIFYSFWTIVFIFVQRSLLHVLEKKTFIIVSSILAACSIAILFYPTIHTILFDSDRLLKQFMS